MGLRTPFALPSFKPLSRTSSPAPLNPSNTLPAPASPPKDNGKLSSRSSSSRGLTRGRDVPPTSFDDVTPSAEAKRSRSLSRPLKILNMAAHTSSRPTTPAPSPALSPKPSPKNAGASLPPSTAGATNGSNGASGVTRAGGSDAASYMEAISMRLGEGVRDALAGSAGVGDFKGRKGLARGAGRDLGAAVIREFPSPPIDMYVLRAIVRTTVKHLSVFATRIENVLLPALLDPTFSYPILAPPIPPSNASHGTLPLSTASTSNSANPFNVCQTYTLSLAHACLELRAELSAHLARGAASSTGLGVEAWPKFVHESYKPVLEKLDSVVSRCVQPLLATLKRELIVTLDAIAQSAGGPPPLVHHASSIAKATAGHVLPTLMAGAKSFSSPFPSPSPGPGPGALGPAQPVPAALSAFAGRMELARKALAKLVVGSGEVGEGWVVGLVVAVIWKGMAVIVARPPSVDELKRIGSPRLLGGQRKLTDIPLPSTRGTASRPNSPPHSSPAVQPLSSDPQTLLLTSFQTLICRLLHDLIPLPQIPIPSPPPSTTLAQEALAEALEALYSLHLVVNTLGKGNAGLTLIEKGLVELAADGGGSDGGKQGEELLDALDDVPPVLLFHLFSSRLVACYPSQPPIIREIWEMLGWTKEQYGTTVLAGFGAAEEWEDRVGVAVGREVRRALGVLGEEKGEERRLLQVLEGVVTII